MRIEPGNSTEPYLHAAFSWLARIGACPRFGDRPIGWYQMHAHAALKYLEGSKARGLNVRCDHGMIQAQATKPRVWFNIVTALELYSIADQQCRS